MAKRLVTQAGVVVLSVSAVGFPAQAQDEAAKGSAQPVFEEILVTAQRREERLQDVPISVAVMSGVSLQDRNVAALDTLSQTVPGVWVAASGPSSNLFIRGVGSTGSQSFDQSVAIFIDEVYHGRSRMSTTSFLDLERVEILKGPQSTYFGNNAIAGALSLISRKPGDEFNGYVRALYGQHGHYALEGAVGGPLTDTFGMRMAATYNGYNGWIDNITTGETVPEEENLGGRVTLAFNPLENLRATLKVEGVQHRLKGSAYTGAMQLFMCPPPQGWPGGNCGAAASLGLPVGLDNDKSADAAGLSAGQVLSGAEGVLTVNYRNAGYTLTSISALNNFRYHAFFSTSGIPTFTRNVDVPESFDQFSQELRIASPEGQRLEYLAGLYYQTGEVTTGNQNTFYSLTGAINTNPTYAPLIPYTPVADNISASQDEDSYAVFGSVSWRVTDDLKLTGGLRGTRVDKDYSRVYGFGSGRTLYGGFDELPANLVPLAGALLRRSAIADSGSRSDQQWQPSASAQYQLRPGTMTYLSYTRGYKAGGFNFADSTGDSANVPFGPEKASAYEWGLKSQWLDDRLLLNLSVFRNEISDLQVGVVQVNFATGTVVTLVKNAAEARSQGVEMEAQWLAGPNFRLQANVTYLNSEYSSYENAPPTVTRQVAGDRFQDLSGKPTTYAPEWSGTVTGTFTLPLSGGYTLNAELTPFYSSSYKMRDQAERVADGRFAMGQDSYLRLDARLNLESPDGRWAVDLIGRNLTDEVIQAAQFDPWAASKLETRYLAAQFRYQW